VRLSESLRPVEAVRPPAKPFAPGEVLLIGDSQMERSILDDYPGGAGSVRSVALPNSEHCTWPDYEAGICDAKLAAASTVVIERVGRNAREIGTGCWRAVTVAAEPLRGRKTPWVLSDGSRVRGRLAVNGSVSVSFAPPSGDVSAVPRLMRLPILQLPAPVGGKPSTVSLGQQHRVGGEVPCATPTQEATGRSLIFPIPANRRAADLQVVLQAPAGTVLGAPEELILDGKPLR
ncbi:MAG: hypothetical protein JHD16_01560, partial [Solirubrobacteraceae bacterium]|nr:hypothetical protein [Solirubrobacteraceae bacterium]